MKRKFLSLLLVLALGLTLLPAVALAATTLEATIADYGMYAVAAPGASRTLEAYVCDSDTNSMSPATGTAIQWQYTQYYNTGLGGPIYWQNLSGATSQSQAVTAPAAGTITFYRVIIDGEISTWCALAGSNTQVTGATDPTDQTVEVGQTATFNSAFTATPNADNLNVAWYVSRDGGNSYDAADTGASYTTSPVAPSNDGYLYLYIIEETINGLPMAHYVSNSARLTVVRPPEQPAGPIPPTGDSATPYLLGGLAALLLLGLGISLTVRRRQNG